MKILLIAFVLFVGNLTAGVVGCTPDQSTVVDSGVAGFELYSCPGDPAATKARVILSGSFQDNSSDGPELSVLFSLAAAGFPDLSCTAMGVTFGTQTLGACTIVGDWIDVAGLPAFEAFITGGPGSIPLPFNASASVKVESEVPEPATMALAGIGLLLVGLRRRQ